MQNITEDKHIELYWSGGVKVSNAYLRKIHNRKRKQELFEFKEEFSSSDLKYIEKNEFCKDIWVEAEIKYNKRVWK